MVPRIVSRRTRVRSSSPRLTSYGSNDASRACSERYGGRLSWACSPTRWRTIVAAGRSARASRCWRCRRVRFSRRGVSRELHDGSALPDVNKRRVGVLAREQATGQRMVMVRVSTWGPPPSPSEGSSVFATNV